MVERLAGAYRKLLSAWGRAVQDRAAAVAIMLLAVTLGLGWFAAVHLRSAPEPADGRSDAPLIVAVESDNPDLAARAAERLAEALRARSELFGAVSHPPGEPFFKIHALLYLDLAALAALSDRLTAAQPVLTPLWRDPSLRGLQAMMSAALDAPPGFDSVMFLADMAEVAEAQIQDRPAVLSWRKIFGGPAVGSPAREVIVVQPRPNAAGGGRPARQAIAATAQQLGLNRDDGLRLRLTGEAVLAQEARGGIGAGTMPGVMAAAVLAMPLLWWGLRSLALALAVAFSSLAGLVWTLAWSAGLAERLSPSAGAWLLIPFALGIVFGMQVALCAEDRQERGQEADAALAATGPALTLTALAAVLALLCFLPSLFVPLAELGRISAGGAAAVWAAALTLLPAFIALIPARRVSRMAAQSAASPHVSAKVRLALAALLAAAALAAVPAARIDAGPLSLADPQSEAASLLRDLADDPWVSPYGATAAAPTLAEAQILAERLRGLEPVARTATLADTLPGDQAAKLRIIDDLAQRLAPSFAEPQAPPLSNVEKQKAVAALRDELEGFAVQASLGPLRDAAARLSAALDKIAEGGAEAALDLQTRLLGSLPDRLAALRAALEAGPVTLADLPSDVVSRATAADGRALIRILPAGENLDPQALRRFVAAVRTVAPAAGGPAVEIADREQAIRMSLLQAGGLASVVAALLLRAGSGQWRAAAYAVAAPVLAVLLTVAFTVIGGMAFTPATIGVLPLAAVLSLALRALPPRPMLFGGLALAVAAAGFGILPSAAAVLSLLGALLLRR